MEVVFSKRSLWTFITLLNIGFLNIFGSTWLENLSMMLLTLNVVIVMASASLHLLVD